MNFRLKGDLTPAGDQPKAIEEIVNNIKNGKKYQVLLGATGTGKTFTMANIISSLQTSTLIIAHNKTLAMQIFSEMKDIFLSSEDIEVCYYVSFFDYYRPESYKPNQDLYLEKRTQKNKTIEKMRMNTLKSLSSGKKVIVVASVACIYGCISPYVYKNSLLKINKGDDLEKNSLIENLQKIGYKEENGNLRLIKDKNERIKKIDIIKEDDSIDSLWFSEEIVNSITHNSKDRKNLEKESCSIFPVQYVIENKIKLQKIVNNIKKDLFIRKSFLKSEEKHIEAKRIERVVNSDLEDIEEFGFCSGIENYSPYFDERQSGDSPFTILDFFSENDFLTIIDESHITIPQIRAMHNTDRNRKKTLVEHGFRLPSALDNRPLNFQEFDLKTKKTIYVSATPGDFEIEKSNLIVEQIIRPTGLVDPKIEVRNSRNQMKDIISEIEENIKMKQRILIYALTISMSEKISLYLQEKNIKSVFVHSKMNIFDRYQAISNLRRGIYDVIVGINLLKEGIDIPEVSLVCIIDADKSGFLRDFRSLIQIIGRASRNKNGRVIMYADSLTKDIKKAIDETDRRRSIQIIHNQKNGIVPKTVEKRVFSNILFEKDVLLMIDDFKNSSDEKKREKILKKMERIIKSSIKEFNFDKAIEIRNVIFELKNNFDFFKKNN